MNKILWFGAKKETVVHQAYWNVSSKNAFEICKDYAEFLGVMLSEQKDSLNIKWQNGGPGEIGSQVAYTIKTFGLTSRIVEEITEIKEDEESKTYNLAWEQLSSNPHFSILGYGCTWVIKSVDTDNDSPCCQLIWTRHFQQPRLFGLFSLTQSFKNNFSRQAGPIMDWVFRTYYAKNFPPPNRCLPKISDRVVIIGAGPSGLHMAHLLRREVGVQNITILERSSRHGGKSVSVQDNTHPEIIHELGTCYLHPGYFAVRSLVNQLRSILGPKAGNFGDEVAPEHYSISRTGKGDSFDLPEWMITNIQVQPRWSPMAIFRILWPKLDTGIEVAHAVLKYNRLHERYLGRYDFSMPPQPTNDVLKQLDMSFGQYLEINDLNSLLPLLAYAQTVQGYGSIENTPTFWALCWITPELLNGYIFNKITGSEPRKSMFRYGWETVWDTIIQINNFNVRYNTEISSIIRQNNGPILVRIKDGELEKIEEFDYLVVAAPLINPDPNGEEVILDLHENEKELLRSKNTTSCQFRTNLFKTRQPMPYLDAHVTLSADFLIGPEAGHGDVFGFRDSYLALNPQYCTSDGHKDDPNRNDLREQMSYQWVEFDKELPAPILENKFQEWAVKRFGNTENYEKIRDKTWTYFQHFNRQGLEKKEPWKVLEIQGRNRTLFVHASNFFESVLDIVNYNNMLVEGLSGKLNDLSHPKSDAKPLYYQSLWWRYLYNKHLKNFFIVLNVVLGSFWTVIFFITRPLFQLTLNRWLRYRIQNAFKTKDTGPWWKFSMSHFIKVSPEVICFVDGRPDEIVELSRQTLKIDHPEIPSVDQSLRLSYHDFRNLMKVWMKLLNPNFLTFITPARANTIRWIRSTVPITYNYIMSWFNCIAFNFLTGYSVRIEDEKGGGCYVPKCDFLATAKQEYGDQLGSRICTHGCKIFIEEAMKLRGFDCVLEPNHEEGSCMLRQVPYQSTAFADHSVDHRLTILK